MHWIFNLTQEYVHSRIKTPNRIYTLLNSCISKRYIIEKDVTNGLGYNRISKKKNKEISERGLKRHLKKMEDKVSSWDLGLDSYLMSYLFHELINYDKDVKRYGELIRQNEKIHEQINTIENLLKYSIIIKKPKEVEEEVNLNGKKEKRGLQGFLKQLHLG